MATGVAAIGGGNRQAVVVVDVAEGASHIRVSVGKRKAGCGVIENARGPRCDGVAGRARRRGCRETGRDVVWYRSAYRCGADESRLMAAVTIRGIERVVVVHVARRTGSRRRGHVRSGQRKSGDAVIECRRGPARRRMTCGAIRGGESRAGSGVDRSSRLLPGGQMALRVAAIGWRNGQIVVVVDVAQIAGHVGMPAGQQKTGRAVVKRCCRPTDRRMAG